MNFYDTENCDIITEGELKIEYQTLKEAGETEAESFSDYVINCTDKNGTLEPMQECEIKRATYPEGAKAQQALFDMGIPSFLGVFGDCAVLRFECTEEQKEKAVELFGVSDVERIVK